MTRDDWVELLELLVCAAGGFIVGRTVARWFNRMEERRARATWHEDGRDPDGSAKGTASPEAVES